MKMQKVVSYSFSEKDKLGSSDNAVYEHEGNLYKKVILENPELYDLTGDIDRIYAWSEKLKELKKDYLDVRFDIRTKHEYGDEVIHMEVTGYKELTETESKNYKEGLESTILKETQRKEAEYERLKELTETETENKNYKEGLGISYS